MTFYNIISCSILSHPSKNHITNNNLVHVITVPPKNWQPKAKNNYKPIIYTDVDDDLYVLKHFCKYMTRSPTWKSRPRSAIITPLLGRLPVGGEALLPVENIFGVFFFYWICDCNDIKEVLDYDRSIHQLKR